MFGHASMNRAFKLVWNSARGAYVAVPESAKGHGGTSTTVKAASSLASVFLALGLIGPSPRLYAQVMSATTVVPTGSVANAYLAGNGVPVVNINTANSAGVSHNKFTRFDVEAKGLVLNNGNNTQAARQSQLAGQVVGNTNLINEARIIINEVVSTNRSMLGGFIEVLGSRADVIVANPYGISCAGCGFINTDRITLTTGVPVIGLDGSLSGFNVSRGDILINGTGLNATAQQILDLLARSVRLDGQINISPTGSIGITTGLNQWSYITRSVTGSTTGADAVPVLALDSTALGGMYAGRIRLIATEAGVGVRMLGTAAASADDFQLTSAGRVEIRSAISAERDLQISSTQSKSEAIALTDAQLTAKRDLSVVSQSGAASVQGGALVAGNRLSVNVGSLTDVSTATAITDNNRRFGSTVTLASAGAAQVGGVSWGSVNDLNATASSLAVTGNAATNIYAGSTLDVTTASNMNLAGAAVRATGNVNLTATSGVLTTTSGSGQGVQSTQGNVNLTAGSGLQNAGTITSDVAAVTVRAGVAINNSGAIYAKTKLDLADATGSTTASLTNSGSLLADGQLAVSASDISNLATGGIQGSHGTTIQATKLTNAGLIVLSPSTAYDGVLNLGTLTNSTTGVIQSGRDLSVNIANSLSNDGLLIADRDLKITASNAAQTLSISNTSNGYLQAGGSLSVGGTAGGSNVNVTTQSGVLYGAQNVDLKLAALNSSGYIQSGAGLDIASTGTVTNSGNVLASGALGLSASTLTNSGSIQANLATTINATELINSGLINGAISGTADTVLTLGTLGNTVDGTIQSARDLNLNVSTSVINAGDLIADRHVNLLASNAGVTLGIANQGYVGAGQKLTIAGTAGASNANITSQSGTLLGGTNVDLKLAGLNSSGVIQAAQAATISSSGNVANSGFVAAGTTLTLNATVTATNTATGTLQAANGFDLTAGTFANSGLVIGNTSGAGSLAVSVGTLTNAGTGAIESTTDLSILASALVSNSGSLYAARDVSIAGSASTATASVQNLAGSEILAGGALSIKAAALSNAAAIQSAGAMTLNVSGGTLSNTGTIYGAVSGPAATRMDVTAATLSNSANAQIRGNGTTAVSASQIDNSGDILGGNASDGLTVNSAKLTNTATGVIQSLQNLTVNQNTAGVTNALVNSGYLVAAGDLKVTNAGVVTATAIQNAATGVIQAGNALTIEGSSLDFGSGSNGQAGTVLGKDVSITATQFVSGGNSTTQASNDLKISATNGLSNGGLMIASGGTTLTAGSAANLGAIQSAKGLALTASIFQNYGTAIGSTNNAFDTQLNVNTLENLGTGSVQSARDLQLNVRDTLTNSGKLLADRDLKVAPGSASSTLTVSNNASALMQAVGTLSAGPTVGKSNFVLATQAGTLAAGAISLGVTSLTNTGVIQSDANLGLALTGDFNNSGALVSGGTLNLSAVNVNNSTANSLIQAKNGGTISATDTLTNVGAIVGSTEFLFGAPDAGATAIYAKTLSNQSGAVIQSANNLGFGITNKLTNSGTITGERRVSVGGTASGTTVDLTNNATGYIGASTNNADLVIGDGTNPVSIKNLGTMASAQKLTINAAAPVQNSSLMAAGEMKIAATELSNFSTGTIQNTGRFEFNVGTLANEGAMVLAGGFLSGFSGINADTLFNAGGATITGSQYYEIYAKNKLDNAGLISSASRMYISNKSNNSAEIINRAAGVIQGDGLWIRTEGTAAPTISMQAGKIISDSELIIHASGNLTNTGTIQGGKPFQSYAFGPIQSTSINIEGTLTNAAGATFIVSDADPSPSVKGKHSVFAPSIINKGTMGSGGDTTFYVGSGGKFSNEGTLTFDGALKVSESALAEFNGTEAANQYTFENKGTLSVGGLLSLRGMSNNLEINATSKWFAESMDIVTPIVNIAAGQMLNTSGNLTLSTGQLNFADSTSRIIAATSGSGLAKITLPNSYTYNNIGIIFSGGDLELNTRVLNNKGTGALAASGNVTLNAKDGMVNNGALYSGNDLTINADVFENSGANASMDSGRDINVTALYSFTNSASIDAGRDITISTQAFSNQPVGGDTRIFTPMLFELPGFPGAFIRIYDGSNGSGTATGVGLKTIQSLSFKGSYAFAGGLTPTKPTITANRNITIKDFNSGSNLGGLISAAGTLTLTGANAKSTFLNRALNVTKDSVYKEDVEYDCATVTPLLIGACLNDPYKYAPASSGNPVPNTVTAVTETPIAGSLSATIRAGTLIATGFGLTNDGSPTAAVVTSKTATGGAKTGFGGLLARANGASGSTVGTGLNATTRSLLGKATGDAAKSGTSATTITKNSTLIAGSPAAASALRVAANKESGITGVTTASGKPAVQFGGVVINLPGNPNGFFVVNKDPAAQFLVETNPLYGVGSNFVGSDYLSVRYGYNPDISLKRLGDANYEAYLIKQQLIGTTGSNLLKGFKNEAAQVQGLMDNALTQGKELGLTYGVAPTKAQLAKLKTSIVWMVETVVDGVAVLAPVVYLPESVRNAIASGATITGDDVFMDLTAVTNKGGTIEGKNNLIVTSKGDITNSGGTIRGGNVSLTSTQGSIVNRTESAFQGNSSKGSTVIGRTGVIQSDKTLILDARKDITVLGAQITAGGSASIKAGNNITFDTIQDRTTSSSSETTRTRGRTTTTTTNTETVNQVKSGLTVGGNLSANAGNNLTFAGTDVNVGGGASLKAGNNVSIIGRENTVESSTTTTSKGTGAFAGLRSSSTSTTDSTQTRNVGSNLNIGGGLNVEAGKDAGTVLIQGSNLNAAGSVRLAGGNVQILEGRNTDTSTTTTTSKSAFLSQSRGAGASGQSGTEGASASAGAQGNAQSNVTFSSTTKSTETNQKSTSVGSSINAGKSIVIESANDLTVQGSKLNATENVFIDAKNINVLAATNTDVTTRTSSTNSVGLFTDSTNKGSTGAAAGTQGGTAQAKAGADAKSENNLDFARQTRTTNTDVTITNSASSISGGGVVVLNATNKVTVQGSDIAGDQGVSITGKDIAFLAAQDTKLSTSTTNTTSQGLYLDGEAKASANAGIGAGGAGAFSNAEARVAAGVQVRQGSESNASGSSTARVSSITSKSGNIERTATNSIVDVGTSIDAAGAFVQKSDTFTSSAAQNTTFSTSSKSDTTARVGAFAGADAQQGRGVLTTQDANGKSDTQVGAGQSTGGGTKGAEVSVERNTANDQSKSSTAVVSNIRAGSVDITTTGKATLQGTNIQSKGDVVLDVGSLDFQTAKNTNSSSSSGTGTKVGAEIGKKEVTISGERSDDRSSLEQTNAVVGGIQAGGNVTIRSAGDARLEGTNVAGKNGVNLDVAGNVDLAAAKNTSVSSGFASAVSGELSVGKGSKGTAAQGGKFDGELSMSNSQSSTAVAGTLGSSGGPVTINAGGNVRTEGTNLNSGTGQASLNAGGSVIRDNAVSTSSSSSLDASLNVSVAGQKNSQGGTNKGGVGGGSFDETSNQSVSASAGTTAGVKVTEGTKPAASTTPKTETQKRAEAKAKAAADAKTKAEAAAKAKAEAEAAAKAKASAQAKGEPTASTNGAPRPAPR